jgi:hypothetical protein
LNSYARTFELPVEVTEDGTDASFENGVLTLRCPNAPPLPASASPFAERLLFGRVRPLLTVSTVAAPCLP